MQEMHGKQKDAENADIKDLDLSQRRGKLNQRGYLLPVNEEIITRARVPRSGQVIGVVEQMMGFGKMKVRCVDGNTRLCRVPGKFRRRLWIKVGNIVLIEPWELSSEERGDIIYRYTRAQAGWLVRKGYLDRNWM